MPHMNINPIDLVDAIPYVLGVAFLLIVVWLVWVTIDSEPDEPAPPERD